MIPLLWIWLAYSQLGSKSARCCLFSCFASVLCCCRCVSFTGLNLLTFYYFFIHFFYIVPTTVYTLFLFYKQFTEFTRVIYSICEYLRWALDRNINNTRLYKNKVAKIIEKKVSFFLLTSGRLLYFDDSIIVNEISYVRYWLIFGNFIDTLKRSSTW